MRLRLLSLSLSLVHATTLSTLLSPLHFNDRSLLLSISLSFARSFLFLIHFLGCFVCLSIYIYICFFPFPSVCSSSNYLNLVRRVSLLFTFIVVQTTYANIPLDYTEGERERGSAVYIYIYIYVLCATRRTSYLGVLLPYFILEFMVYRVTGLWSDTGHPRDRWPAPKTASSIRRLTMLCIFSIVRLLSVERG